MLNNPLFRRSFAITLKKKAETARQKGKELISKPAIMSVLLSYFEQGEFISFNLLCANVYRLVLPAVANQVPI